MSKLLKTLSILFILLQTYVLPVNSAELSPMLEPILDNPGDSLIELVVFIENSREYSQIAALARQPLLNKTDRIKQVVTNLKSYKNINQANIYNYLQNIAVGSIKSNWIVPAYTLTINTADLKNLSEQIGVKLIITNVALEFESPTEVVSAPLAVSTEVSSHLQQINVPYLWSLGLKGQGRLICSFDTGVEQAHPALSSKWRGNNNPLTEAWFSKVKPDSLPFDATGHGTHTMGIMVGSSDTDSFGVAPAAEWITAGVIDQGRSLSVTISDILDAFEWSLNPDGDLNSSDDVPDVILNSWGIPRGLFVPCDETFWGVIDNVEAAGIVTIFAAGNEGPNRMTMRSPADRASSAINAFSVGAVDEDDVIANFSSRGPSSCDTTKIKPELVAPGVMIRSCARDGLYAYMSGTSMAAPYIAGLVVLMKQYNPEATVEQIKNALINSARDMGEAGDDNAYGHGLIDASKLLEYLPLPETVNFELTEAKIIGDGIARPGELSELQITLSSSIGDIGNITGTIIAVDESEVLISTAASDFFFGLGGTIALSGELFEFRFDSSLYHGQRVAMTLLLSDTLRGLNESINFNLTVGLEPPGHIAEEGSSGFSLTISDFGQYGFAENSIYNLSGSGLRFNNSENLLYEAGIVLGQNVNQLATSIRNSDGSFKPTDFITTTPLSNPILSAGINYYKTASFQPNGIAAALPVEIYSETYFYNETIDDNYIVIKYRMTNNNTTLLTDLSFGFLADFDLSLNDSVIYMADMNLVYQTDNANRWLGLVALEGLPGVKSFINPGSKIGLNNEDLYNTISSPEILVNNSSGDQMLMLTSGNFDLDPGESKEIIIAFVAGTDLGSLITNSNSVRDIFKTPTDIEDGRTNLPDEFKLYPNYPNPFNPTTTIQFDLNRAAETNLEIYNLIGQKIKTIQSGFLNAGSYEFEWNATDNHGRQVASGIYFYRLYTESISQTQKMVLLK